MERASTTVSIEWYLPAFLKAIFVHSLDLCNANLFLEMYWGVGVGVPEGEGRGNYSQNYTVTTRMTLAFRWAALKTILTFH